MHVQSRVALLLVQSRVTLLLVQNEEINGGTEKRQNSSFEFERTSGRKDNEDVSNTESERTRSNDQGLWQRSSRIDRGQRTDRSEINVANANDEGVRTRIGGSDNDYETESRSRGTDGGRSTSDDERHNIASTEIKEVDVANTESFGSRETRYSDQEERSEGSRATQLDGSRRDVANTERKGLEGFSEQSTTIGGQDKRTFIGNESSRSSTIKKNWWEFEPDVGRVAYGIPGRVHRLKALGNSIVPKIVEEIGYALIKGMK